ncbi:MAG: YggS family pyridoxal phosphate-dependent enzyme [Saprospiraceae bacterium]|nr:YggS family pyridoxal phosphate-dependent enzyme [Saprospiraceae bacterium]
MNIQNYYNIRDTIKPFHAKLLVVTKNQTIEDILKLYKAGQREFGENRVQLLKEKKELLPSDIKWHMIGTLQKNKVKSIIQWIEMIHSVDSFELVNTIEKEAKIINKNINILLEVKIANEPSKFGFTPTELLLNLKTNNWIHFKNVKICGLMAMASNTEDQSQINAEFHKLKELFETIKNASLLGTEFTQLSIGMSNDYKIALQNGSTIVRIGSTIFN